MLVNYFYGCYIENMETTLTDRGQTAVPASIRKQLHLKPGQKLQWVADGQVVYMVPVPADPIAAFRGSAKAPGLNRFLLESRAEDAKR